MHSPTPLDPPDLTVDGGGTLVPLKVVPGAKRVKISGPHGNAPKLSVAQPPENGAANRAVCELLADALGVPPSSVGIIQGPTRPWKTARVAGLVPDAVRARPAGLYGRR